jgi:FtsZ-binding cell division protein ZapB
MNIKVLLIFFIVFRPTYIYSQSYTDTLQYVHTRHTCSLLACIALFGIIVGYAKITNLLQQIVTLSDNNKILDNECKDHKAHITALTNENNQLSYDHEGYKKRLIEISAKLSQMVEQSIVCHHKRDQLCEQKKRELEDAQYKATLELEALAKRIDATKNEYQNLLFCNSTDTEYMCALVNVQNNFEKLYLITQVGLMTPEERSEYKTPIYNETQKLLEIHCIKTQHK